MAQRPLPFRLEERPEGGAVLQGLQAPEGINNGNWLLQIDGRDVSNWSGDRIRQLLAEAEQAPPLTLGSCLEVALPMPCGIRWGRGDLFGVSVWQLTPGGAAEVDGRVVPGDELLVVNGEDVCELDAEEAMDLMCCAIDGVTFQLIRRVPIKAGQMALLDGKTPEPLVADTSSSSLSCCSGGCWRLLQRRPSNRRQKSGANG
eukprot:TRINITY_DN31521_c0_g2_i2.p1 TRINITY_DN31521_c0_g2~~TRINITY_DN31521_c0_g2_i2.p1  ORF type:complete len:202 (+),score=37.97 TRINITY_DN31521_c0_g2_i2:196-801(+)